MAAETADFLEARNHEEQEMQSITFSHHGTTHTVDLPLTATISDLSSRITADFNIPEHHQKFMITPKTGLIKPPFSKESSLLVSTLQSKKIVLLAPTASDLSSISRPQKSNSSASPSTLKAATPSRTSGKDWRKVQEESLYTFSTIIPLAYLPNPSRSQKYLERLRDDPGIKASMRKHQFRVGVLTEMDPAAHTTHDSRTLGLNRNRGEIIELRLRTDAYDGYRDYKIIRDTLCHELAHNVFGEHDRNFWDLCRQIEKEVRENDWKSGGMSVGNEVYYDPAEREGSGSHVDGGGWTGGEYVLGGASGGSRSGVSRGDAVVGTGGAIDRREAMAKAAEERARKQKELGGNQGAGPMN